MEDDDPFRLSSYIHRTSGFKVSNNCSLYITFLLSRFNYNNGPMSRFSYNCYLPNRPIQAQNSVKTQKCVISWTQ